MSVRLEIVWDGDEPGLKEHRLSLISFGKPLDELLRALRRTGSIIRSDNNRDPSYGVHGGSLHADAKRLDIQITAMSDGCVQLSTILVQRSDDKAALLPGMEDREFLRNTLRKAVEDIESEAKNKRSNDAINRYLRSIPPGVTTQKYSAWDGDELLAEVSLGEIVVEEPRVPPQAFSYVGPVDSVGFDHTRKSPWVGLHIGARTRRCEATNEHLATAQAHSENVQAAVLYLPKGPSGQPAWRLLWIRSGHAVIAKPDKNDHSQIFKRWGAVLERLGK